jgi:DeoR family transcriptional regulator, aga operon transcriptional repressor
MKSAVDRRDLIIRLLHKEGKIRIPDLSRMFEVSSVTIRNDLAFLEKKGYIHRTHGGALVRNRFYDSSFHKEINRFAHPYKSKIGTKAVEMISDGDHILLDSYANFRFVDQLLSDKKNLTVMTNSLRIALKLQSCDNLNLILTGGVMNKESGSFLGPEAEATIKNFYFDKLFLGIDGLDINYGLTLFNPVEAQLNKVMLQRAKQVIVVATTQNFGKRKMSHVCSVNDVNTIITDNISSQFEIELSRRNVKVIKA